MKNETTNYNDESTQYNDNSVESAENKTEVKNAEQAESAEQGEQVEETEQTEKTAQAKRKSILRKAAVGLGGGLVLGAVGSVLTSSASASDNLPDQEHMGNASSAIVDENVQVASSVEEEMDFDDAFAAAREELGAGGVFEWRGNLYSTYTQEEWDNMTPEEQEAYYEHFNWSTDSDNAEPAVTEEPAAEAPAEEVVNEEAAAEEAVVEEPVAEEAAAEEPVAEEAASEEPVVEEAASEEPVAEDATAEEPVAEEAVVAEEAAVEEPVAEEAAAEEPVAEVSNIDGDVQVVETTPDVEVLGVVQDSETGANIGTMVVDDQEVVLIDIDGDGATGGDFEVMGTDANGDGIISEDEMLDISDEEISVGQFESNAIGDDSLYTNDDDGSADYIEDGLV